MTEKPHEPKKSSLNELFPDRLLKENVESNRKKFNSPKNTFERNFNRLFKEFKSTDYNPINSQNSVDTCHNRRNKQGLSLESKEEKIHLKALQSNIENKNNTKKDVKAKLKEMKILCLTQNLIQPPTSPNIKEEASHQKLFAVDSLSSLSPEFLTKTENRLKKNDYISDKMKNKIINVYKKANQSGVFESELNKNSISNLTEISLMSLSPIGRKEVNFNSFYNINNSVYSINSKNSDNLNKSKNIL